MSMRKGSDVSHDQVLSAQKPGTTELKKRPFRQFIQDFCPGVALSLACCFLVAVYGPLELYFTNLEEFWFGFGALFPPLLKLFFLGFAVCLIVLALSYLLFRRVYDVLICAGMAGFLCTYIQGMFFAGKLPGLDGSYIDWNQFRMENIQSVVLWIAVWAAVALAARFLHRRRMYKLISGLSLFFTAILLVTGIAVGLLNHGFASKPVTIMTTDGQFTMSTDQNLVIFVVDAVDAETIQNMMETTDPEFAKVLEDFTFYPNTTSAYPFTKYALPYILHGQWYENQEDYYSFSKKALAQSPLLGNLRRQGYRMGIYEEDARFIGGNSISDLENLLEFRLEIADEYQLVKEEIKLVWFKYAPWPLKPYVKVDMDRFVYLTKIPDGAEWFNWRNDAFYASLDEVPVTKVPEKCFRMFHTEGAHVPFRYDKNVNRIENGSYEQNMQCNMTVISAYLQKLKDADVYDNTAIVLLADHGYDNFTGTPLIGRCNPFLAVKGVNEHHPMETSEAPISYEDLQELYRRLLDKKSGAEVFDAREGDKRDRRILMYYYLKEAYIAEYLQTGHASDTDTLVPTDVIYER